MVVVIGHLIVEYANSTSMLIVKVCVEVAELGIITIMSTTGDGLV